MKSFFRLLALGLAALSVRAADLLGLKTKVGQVTPGFYADITLLENPSFVMKGGEVIKSASVL